MKPAAWIESNRERLAERLTELHYRLNPEFEERYGAAGREKCRTDALYHLEYLAAAIKRDSVRLFVDYVAWAKVLLTGLGLTGQDLRVNLELLQRVLRETAPEAMMDSVEAPLETALETLDAMPGRTSSMIDPAAPWAGAARRYLDAIRAGDRRRAVQIPLKMADEGVDIRAIYQHVFTPVMHEIGRLWQSNEITVAEEHYCTAVTQLAISQLYPYVFDGEADSGRTLVATCAAGDLHELGVRMVADFFEMSGWETHYLGANCPAGDVVQTVIDRGANLVAVSATITRNIDAVEHLIGLLRSDSRCQDVPIMVGGYPFNIDHELAGNVGADFFARDPDEALRLGDSVTGRSR